MDTWSNSSLFLQYVTWKDSKLSRGIVSYQGHSLCGDASDDVLELVDDGTKFL